MYRYLPVKLPPVITILLLSVAGVLVFFLSQSHQGLSMLDEGYLWYGAQRVIAGEVPIRDFMAYDIGRYYWSAAFMGLLGDTGIVALRAASAVFQAIALFIGVALLARSNSNQNRFFWILAWITLAVWMAQQFRVYDISLPILLVGALTYLLEQPSSRRYLLSGLIVGLVAVFGRNHGMYGVTGSLSIMLYLTIKREGGPSLITAFSSWALGVVIGYLPVLVFLAVVPGFALAYWESIRFLFEIKATNLSLPVPWPWLVPFGQMSGFNAVRGVLVGIFFIAIVVFGLLGIVWVIRCRIQGKSVSPMLTASVFLALPYAHYAYSRADISHLAPGVPPFLMGILALLAIQPAKIKWPFAALLCGASLWVMLPAYPGWFCYSSQQCVELNVAGDKLNIDRETASNLTALNKLAEQFAPGDRTFIAAPFWPGAYAALGRKSPMWEIYVLFPQRSIAFQLAEIERIKAANPGFAVIHDFPLDGRDDLRFRNSRPIVDQYIRDNFERLNNLAGNPAFQIYRSKPAEQQDGTITR
ncbi:MAG: hypothetical protein ABI479_11270 [Gallionella sp.]